MANGNNWPHWQNTLSLGNVLILIGIIGGFSAGWVEINSRVTENAIRIEEVSARQDRHEVRIAAALEGIDRKLERIESRLDEKADRQ
jgi:hypothetical protein